MSAIASLKLKMENKEQVNAVLPIVKEELRGDWQNVELKLSNTTLSISNEEIEYYEYEGMVWIIFQRIAEEHPEFQFDVIASCTDDSYICNEEGKFANKKLKYVKSASPTEEDGDVYELEYDDFDEFFYIVESVRIIETITGKFVDDKLVLKSTKKVIEDIFEDDEDDED